MSAGSAAVMPAPVYLPRQRNPPRSVPWSPGPAGTTIGVRGLRAGARAAGGGAGSEVGGGADAEAGGLLVEEAGRGQVLGGQAERLEHGDLTVIGAPGGGADEDLA